MADETPTADEPSRDPAPGDDPRPPGDEVGRPDEATTQSLPADDLPPDDGTAVSPAAGVPGDEVPSAPRQAPPPPPAAPPAPGQRSARRAMAVGAGALALVATAVVSYNLGQSDSDDGAPAAAGDERPDGDRDPRGPGGRDGDDDRDGPFEDHDLPRGPEDGPDRGPRVIPGGHGWDMPVAGTVRSLGDDRFEVETLDGDTVTITVSGDTDYTQLGDEGMDDDAALADLEEGDHVLVFPEDDGDEDDEADDDDTVAADEVLFGDELEDGVGVVPIPGDGPA